MRHNFKYFFREGVKNMFSHGFMSFAAIGITVACLLIMGTFTLVAYNANENLKDLQRENAVLAFVDENLSEEEARALQPQLESVPNVADCTFVSREQARDTYVEQYDENDLYSYLDASIFSHRFVLHLTYLNQMKQTTDALEQIPNVQASTYPEFSDLLTALKSGAIDGYVAEEPTAFSVCASNDDLTYLPFKNNDTGFTATAADVGIAIGLKKGNTLRDQINTVLAEITDEQRSELMEQIVTLASGGTVTEFAVHCDAPATTTGTLKIGMECAYEPYNWTDTEGTSLGAVPISSEGQSGLYANGYDVQIAQYVANRLGLKLEIYAMEWDSLIPAVNSGAIDAIVAGMSPTAERSEQLDFTDTYYESNLVVIIRK